MVIPRHKAKEDYDVIDMLKKKYAPLQKKYNLPSFDALDLEFKLYSVDEYTTDILFEIRRQIVSVLDSFSMYVVPILAPSEVDITSLIVSNGLRKETKFKIQQFYKKLNYFITKGTSASLKDEKTLVLFLKEIWKEWPGIKKEMSEYIDKITSVWSKEYKSEKADVGYLG